MNDSIFLALNWAAEIYGRAPLSMPAATWLYMTSGIKDQKAFILQLQELLKTSPTFPLPMDFRKAAAKERPDSTATATRRVTQKPASNR